MTIDTLAPARDREAAAAEPELRAEPDTFPKLLLEHARVRPQRPANREKKYGIWQSWNWAEVAAEVEALACGLAAMGFRRGDKLAVIGDNRPRLYWAQQPHFYAGGLYPYTYSAGLTCAYNVASAIRAEGQPAVDRWLRTLEAGRTLPAAELMRQAGVDLSSPEPIRRAVAFFGTLVDELERRFP